jgi:hypothetical protein
MCDRNNNGGAIMRAGYSPETRHMLFYAVCIPLRVLIGVALIVAATQWPIATAGVTLALACVAMLHYAFVDGGVVGCRWWRPVTLALLSAVVVVVSAGTLAGVPWTPPLELVGALVIAHAITGLAQSIQTRPWK